MVEVNNSETERLIENSSSNDGASTSRVKAAKKEPKRGIIYLSTIPPYMNVTKIRETFSEYGKVGRIYLQLNTAGTKPGDKQSKKKKVAKKFTEGWVEFERKSVAKKVAQLLNNTQVSTRKKSKQYDCIWNIKYLSRFKWTHLHERLAYEKASRKQKLLAEIQLAKKKTNFFTANLGKKKKNKNADNKILLRNDAEEKMDVGEEQEKGEEREEFLQSLFS